MYFLNKYLYAMGEGPTRAAQRAHYLPQPPRPTRLKLSKIGLVTRDILTEWFVFDK